MMKIGIAAVLMGLSVIGAWALAPRQSAFDENLSLDEMVPVMIGEWRLDEASRPILPRRKEENQRVADHFYDRTLVRSYRNSRGDRIMLVIAYGRDQSDTLQIHLPEVCYASQGFSVRTAGRTRINLKNGAAVSAVRLTTRRGRRSEPVTYWTRVGDHVVASNLARQWAKLYIGLQGRVPDGVLVRVSTISARTNYAFAMQERFVSELIRSMDPPARRFLLGRSWP